MSGKNRTTQDLRDILFNSMDDVRSGKLDAKGAAQVANLAKVALDSARLELDHSKCLSKLDADGQQVTTGPLLLTSDNS